MVQIYEIIDEEIAYIIPAKALAMLVIDLLADGAEVGQKVQGNFRPKMSKEQYLREWANLDSQGRSLIRDMSSSATFEMSINQRVLAILEGRQSDKIPFVDRLGTWYYARTFNGTMPTAYAGLSLAQIH